MLTVSARPLPTLTNEVKNKFDYDAVYVDVGIGDDWEIKRDFILAIRDLYSVIPFVLVGHRKIFLQRLTEKESKKFQGYFFFDIGISISQIPTLIQDTLTQVEWDIRARYGVKAV